jgi:hypothetical protein
MSAPEFELLYHNAMPGWVKIKGLDIRAIPECEGGGFAVRHDRAVNSHAALLEAARRLRSSTSIRMNDYLCEMKPGYDDSIIGFNEAWDIVRKILDEFEAAIAAAEEHAP